MRRNISGLEPNDSDDMTVSPAVAVPLSARLYSECPCGWKYRGDSQADLEDGNAFHDPGDSCCHCSGMKCLACNDEIQHEDCYADCPACCVADDDGYTEMERQRRTARWWALTDQRELPDSELRAYLAALAAGHPEEKPAWENEDEAMDFLHTLIERYNTSTHKPVV